MITAAGTYTGDGTSPRTITVGFQPDVVIVKRSTGAVANVRFSTMADNTTKTMEAGFGFLADRIMTLVATGFTVGVNANVSAGTYRWFAAQVEAADSAVFSYTGDGTDNRTVGSFAFTPAFAMGFSDSANKIKWRSDQHAGDSTNEHNAAAVANIIQALNAGSIQVGSGVMNSSGLVYHCWVAAASAGKLATAEYAGNAVDNRDIAHGLGATPIFTLIHAQLNRAGAMVGRFQDHSGDLSSQLSENSANGTAADAADKIQAVDGTNVQIGAHADVNQSTNSPVYTLVTFGGTAPAAHGGGLLLMGVG